MKLKLSRTWPSAGCTIGQLSVDSMPQCYTLEDVVRPAGAPKVFGQTAIPAGVYGVVITFSPHFQRDLPLLVNVPGFESVRIHPGNTAADTEGCILVGVDRASDSIGRSRVAFDALFPKIQQALARGDLVSIEVA
jgi:hypothetical protein